MKTLHNVIGDFITYLKSANTTQKYLANCYKSIGITDADTKSFNNCYRFLYYLEHGHTFYKTANQSPLTTQPILYFYGMVHLIKACLLTVRPDYPENTSMLAHGVSTRKRKKQDYAFLQDEVKVQQKGLFPYFSHQLFQIEQLSFDKFDMNRLLATIPELNLLYEMHRNEKNVLEVGSLSSKQLYFPTELLDVYYVTANQFINKVTPFLPAIQNMHQTDDYIKLELTEPLSPYQNGPFYYNFETEKFYFPNKRHFFYTNHEVMNHYLILYNLSMISRYETEWWGDLLHTMPNEDYPFIQRFLSVTSYKVPLILGYYLYMKK